MEPMDEVPLKELGESELERDIGIGTDIGLYRDIGL